MLLGMSIKSDVSQSEDQVYSLLSDRLEAMEDRLKKLEEVVSAMEVLVCFGPPPSGVGE